MKRLKAKVEAEALEKAMKKIEEHRSQIEEYIALIKDKPDEKLWTSKDMKVVICSLKNDNDGKVSTLKEDIVLYYEQIKGRKENVLMMEYNGYTNNEING